MAIISSDEARRAGLIGGPVLVPVPAWPERDEDLAWLAGAIADEDETALGASLLGRDIHGDSVMAGPDLDARIDALVRARRLRRIRAALG